MRFTTILASAMLALLPSAAGAAVNIYVSDDGTDMTIRVLGNLDLSGFTKITPYGTEPGSDEIQGQGTIYSGDSRQGLQAYTGLTNGNTFGTSTISFANSGSGTGFGINGAYTPPRLLLARTYASGDPIDSTALFRYRTLDSLELVRGTYVYRSSSDTITLRVGQSAPLPEPATWGLAVLGLAAIGISLRRAKLTAAPRRAAPYGDGWR